MKKLAAFCEKGHYPGLLFSGISFAAIAPSHRKRLSCIPGRARVFHTASRLPAVITTSFPLTYSPSSTYSPLFSTKSFVGDILSPLAPLSFPFTNFSSSPPIRSQCCRSRLCITSQTSASCSSVSVPSKPLSSSFPSSRPSSPFAFRNICRSPSLSRSQTVASHTLHHLFPRSTDMQFLPHPFSFMITKLFSDSLVATASLVRQRFCAGGASLTLITQSPSYPCSASLLSPFEAHDNRAAFRATVASPSSPAKYIYAKNRDETPLRAVRLSGSVAFSPVTAYPAAAAGFSSAAAVGTPCLDESTVFPGPLLPGEGRLTAVANSGALFGSCSSIPSWRLLHHHFFCCAVSCNAAEATRKAAEKRNRTAKTMRPRETRVGVRSLRDGVASDNAGDIVIAGKSCRGMCFHSAAVRPDAASSSSLPRPGAAPVGKKEAGTPVFPGVAAEAPCCPSSSSASAFSATESRCQQQVLSEVPFTKKRDMNLKAGPYRRGRIFISPKEDPLEFVLSCIVVFVMLYTLYKLPRGEYLWERRKRVIRERLLKEYGLNEEDMEE